MVKNIIDAIVNTVTEEATAIFPSPLSGSNGLLPLNGNQIMVLYRKYLPENMEHSS